MGILRALLAGAVMVWVSAAAVAAAPTQRFNCVDFVRTEAAFELSGNAWMWWKRAEGRYGRGSEPRVGSVLVFKAAGAMRHGHISLVSAVLDRRTVAIDHANWAPRGGAKGRVERGVLVRDVSPRNDWTEVQVWYAPAATYGRTNPTYGFIYPDRPA